MSKKEQILELARFLDSSHARRVSGADRETVKAIAKLIFELTRERLGKAPAELDGEDVRALLVQLLPERLAPGDSLVAHVPATFEALLEHLEEEYVAAHAFERRQALATHEETFAQAVERSGSPTRAGGETKPFIHGASKLGRNDPCSCGSGKKFKKCHGKGA